jgi:hypothetical protein
MRKRHILIRFLTTVAVVAAGSAVVGHAAGLAVTSHTLGAVSAAVPICASRSVTVTTTHAGVNPINKITLTLTPSCVGATAGATLYVVLAETTTPTHSIGHGTCVLAATCAVTGISVTYSLADSYSLEIVAKPGATGTTSSSANNLKLNSQYLTLRTCTTVSAGPPTTC